MKPNFDLEVEASAEYEYEVRSQVASNFHETSAGPCSDSLTNSSNVTNPTEIHPCLDAISLELTLNFNNNESGARDSIGLSFSSTGESSSEPASKTTAAAIPRVFSHSHQNFIRTGSSNLSFTEVNPPVDIENSTPKLTLKL